jgi:hypothetical protein
MKPRSFELMRNAFEFAIDKLAVRSRSYLIDIATEVDEFTNHACTIQVVDQNRLFDDGEFGLTLYLAFDLTSKGEKPLTRFLCFPGVEKFVDVSYEPEIKCFAMCFGEDIPKAMNVISKVLVFVYECTLDDSLVCVVYDDGSPN